MTEGTAELIEAAWTEFAQTQGIDPSWKQFGVYHVFSAGWSASEARLDYCADQLRESADSWERIAKENISHAIRLHKEIENAPHEYLCRSVDSSGAVVNLGSCTCWKADVP